MADWDQTTDFIVVGSGAGAMTGALVAHDFGARVLVVEKQGVFGGTSSLSGGVIWIPNNHRMARAGIPDSDEEALQYLQQVTGGAVPRAKLQAYIKYGREMAQYLEQNARVAFEAAEAYADYYPELPGGKPGGRSMDPLGFSRRKLGREAHNLNVPAEGEVLRRFAMTAREVHTVMQLSLRSVVLMSGIMLRYYLDLPYRLRGLPDARLTLGRALVGMLRRALMDRDVPVWLQTPALELIVEDRRVVGLAVGREGRRQRIRAEKGVLIAAGGFAHDRNMRNQYGQLPTGEHFSSANTGNTGDGIRLGLAVGADLEFMRSAWWTPSVRLPNGEAQALIVGKSLPGGIFVDSEGRRFTNESAPYEDVTKAQQRHHRAGTPAIPCHMVFDARFRRNYPAGPLPPSKAQPDALISDEYKKAGFLKKAPTLEGLAGQIGVPAQNLIATVERFNGFAQTGKDLDFGRGDSATDRYYSDPRVKPNPTMAPIAEAPFYAMAIYPGDLGTKGGLRCDELARVLDCDGRPIPGLYVTGNSAGSVMGDSYPGAGSTIGPSMTFAYVAARHATGSLTVHGKDVP